jgi:endogenous inhibitor of DNA gyrase (YacG/DUF329 family)
MVAARRHYTYSCVICHTEFHPARKEDVCCSVKCGARYRDINMGRLGQEIACLVCGKKVWMKPFRLKKHKTHFCSRQCYWLWKKEACKGEHNSNYSYGGLKLICPTCGKEFITYGKKQRFCSPKCRKTVSLCKRGTRFECKARKELRLEGYIVIRSSRSLTEADLVAFNLEHIIFIQVKATMNHTTPANILFKKEIENLKNMPTPKETLKQFWIWRDRMGWEKLIV